MKSAVFFSIIIPTLNEEKYLSTILNSLSHQTFADFEVLVIDAHSRDKTGEIVKRFQRNVPELSFHQSDQANVGYQRNLGAKKAKGSYYIFLDADVDVGMTYLEEIHLAAVKKNFLLATTWIEPDSNKSIDRLMILLSNLYVELAKEVNKPFIGGYNTIVRHDVFLRLQGYREDMIISEDHDLALRALKKNIEITILKEPRLIMSLRRFRSEGTLNVLRKYAQANIHLLVKGPITSELFEYKMGGHIHKRRRKKIDLTKLNTYIRAIDKLQRGLINLLKE